MHAINEFKSGYEMLERGWKNDRWKFLLKRVNFFNDILAWISSMKVKAGSSWHHKIVLKIQFLIQKKKKRLISRKKIICFLIFCLFNYCVFMSFYVSSLFCHHVPSALMPSLHVFFSTFLTFSSFFYEFLRLLSTSIIFIYHCLISTASIF